MADRPNPLRVAWSIWRARRVRPPEPSGSRGVDHAALRPILDAVARGGVDALPELRDDLLEYRRRLEAIDPDHLTADDAKAYWLNLYNAGALDLAGLGAATAQPSVLRVPGGFSRPWTTVAGENLSLDDIEHGKIRRLGDPRIHGALVCGSASCPTLRPEPYRGEEVESQLGDQMRSFLAAGGAVVDQTEGVLRLSRVFLWYGGDFTRPHRMPTWLPARGAVLADALGRWLPGETVTWIAATGPKVEYQAYDWGLACAVG